MSEPRLRLSISEHVATITLSHPEKLNVLSRDLLVEFRTALASVSNHSVRVLLIEAEGRAFSSGGDLSDPAISTGDLASALDDVYHPALRDLVELPIPIVAAVHGQFVGGAIGFVLACDVILAASNAVFDFAFARIGLVPDCGLAWVMPRIVGTVRAREILLTGRRVDTAEAERIGLVTEIAEATDLQARSEAVTQLLAGMPVEAQRLTKELCRHAEQHDLADSLAQEVVAQDQAGKAPPFQKLLAARARQ